MVKLVLTTALLCTLAGVAAAQNATLFGHVADQQTGEELVGANVLLVGTSLGASTDVDGNYTIRNVPPGTYSVRFSYVGYTTQTVSQLVLKAAQSQKLDLNLSTQTVNVEEVVITAERVLASEAALLAERKKAAAIGDVMSIEQVKRTPDATSGDALRRVTGISIVDNKFVFIRGITDRYNGTTLDGVAVTSTEAGKKSFSFDMLPANLIENTVVVKSTTPDMPGDMTGGLVQLNTLDFPVKRVMKASVSSSYNDLTTSGEFYSSEASKPFFGFGDAQRAFPGDQSNPITLAQSMPNNWAPRRGTAPLNSAFSLAFGDRLAFNDSDPESGQLGFIGALTWRNSYQRSDRVLDDRDQGRYSEGPLDAYNLLWGGIANLSYKLSPLHKISFRNSYNHSSEDEVSRYANQDLSTSLFNDFTIISYTERSSYTGQLVGEHSFPSVSGLSVQWRASVSSSARQDPDRKEFVYYRSIDDPTQPMEVGYNKRSWAHMNERALSGSVDFTLPVLAGRLKWGGVVENKTTNYQIRYFRGVADYMGGASSSLTRLPIDVVYSPENFGPGKFLFSEISLPSDNYEGDSELYSAYAMFDMPFEVLANRFRLTGGIRMESFEQNVVVPKTLDANGPTTTNQLKKVDLLPSVNLTYIINDMVNLRFAYSHSVNRPDFRERAPIIYEDFIRNELVGGNPNLQRAFIHNYDVRFEMFPAVGEVVALSYFEKRITDAIEEQLLFAGTRSRVYFNSGFARNYGWEIEIRKSLSFLGDYLNNLSVTGNYTRIFSKVEVPTVVGNSTNSQTIIATRPMQGQSPYMINVSVLFTEPTWGTSMSILYNKFGRRLHTVGFNASDIYEEPRDVVDLAVTQPLFAGLEAKFAVRNMLDKPTFLTRDGLRYEETWTGRSYSLQLSVGL